MKLKDFLKELRYKLLIDDNLKAYLYGDKMEIIDYTPGYELQNGEIIDPFYGHVLDIYFEGNTISIVEDRAMKIITPVNKDTHIYLANLIGLEIEDYGDYAKLPNHRDLDCITI